MRRPFGVLSHALPPMWSGQSVVLWKLLRDLEPESYRLIASARSEPGGPASQFIEPLPARTLSVAGTRPLRGLVRLSRRGDGALRLAARATTLAWHLARQRIPTLVACSGDLLDLPAAWLACRLLGVRLVPYLFDDYRTQWADPAQRAFAERLEPRIMARAAAVIVPNEALQEEIERRHGVRARIVRNPVELGGPDGLREPWPGEAGCVRIVYTGAIYHAHFDAFRNLMEAMGRLDQRVELHVYTTQSREQLEAGGLRGPVTVHGHVPPERVREIQRRADILFLPLGFATDIPDVIRTSAPGKTGEYLASGRPLLVHAPEGSFLSRYFTEHRCGFVVDSPDPKLLADTIAWMLRDAGERQLRARRARGRAEGDFGLERARRRFLETVQAGEPAS